jgi:hypothetical protein
MQRRGDASAFGNEGTVPITSNAVTKAKKRSYYNGTTSFLYKQAEIAR